MDVLLDVVGWILILAGSALLIIGGIGLLRMPDFFTRLHPAGVIDTGGAILVVLGLATQVDSLLGLLRLLFILLFLLFTSPTACHALAKAARHGGLCPRESVLGLSGEASAEPSKLEAES